MSTFSGRRENLRLDLRDKEWCEQALKGAETAHNLAADMGGMGSMENNLALCNVVRAHQHPSADGGEDV